MIIWTIQPYSVYQQLESKGQFYCDPEKSENLKENNFQIAYNWMIKQMKRRKILPPKDVKVPLWAWYRRDYKHVRPDFRWVRDSEIEVCMEINIPEEKVLLSDFEAWHFVLNDWYYSPATNEQEWERLEKKFDSLPERKQKQVKEKSWQRIFDTDIRHGKWTSNGETIQACFWMLEMSQVRKAWLLKKGEKVQKVYSVD